MTNRKIAIGLVVVALFAGVVTAHAANFSVGVNAYQRGDYATALRIFRQLADQGHAKAQNNLGSMYDNGRGVTKNYTAAARWFRKAADQGHAGSQNNIAVMYYNGRGVTQNYTAAVRWYRKAADQGHAGAQNNIGFMYEKGHGVTQNYTAAVRWYRKAAKQGHAVAQSNLGTMYKRGNGVTKDYAAAVKWYRKAAKQGHAVAQNNLGTMYEKGHGVTKDYAAAVKWYRKAAKQGHAKAQHNLGTMYDKGRRVTQDYAAARGDKVARKNRNIAAKRVTPEDSNSSSATLEGTKWKFSNGTYVEFFANGIIEFNIMKKHLRQGLFVHKRSTIFGKWEQNGHAVKINVNNFTLYEFVINGELMRGTARKLRGKDVKTTRSTSLRKIIYSSQVRSPGKGQGLQTWRGQAPVAASCPCFDGPTLADTEYNRATCSQDWEVLRGGKWRRASEGNPTAPGSRPSISLRVYDGSREEWPQTYAETLIEAGGKCEIYDKRSRRGVSSGTMAIKGAYRACFELLLSRAQELELCPS